MKAQIGDHGYIEFIEVAEPLVVHAPKGTFKLTPTDDALEVETVGGTGYTLLVKEGVTVDMETKVEPTATVSAEEPAVAQEREESKTDSTEEPVA